MKTYLDCIPCIIRQALEAARHVAPHDEQLQRRVLNQVCAAVPELAREISPPMVAELIHGLIRKESEIDDPYRQAKQNNLALALRLESRLEAWVAQHEDPFAAAVQVAIAGNIIDLGANPNFDIESELNQLEKASSELEGLEQLRQAIEKSGWILYIGDNTAEAVFDKVFIRHLSPRKVVFATRARPILNDITEVEARQIGLDRVAQVISSGSPIPGTDLSRTTEEFRRFFVEAPVVIAKGQGNFESLSDAGRTIYFLFKVKCPVVAAMAGHKVGSSVIFPGGLGQTGRSV